MATAATQAATATAAETAAATKKIAKGKAATMRRCGAAGSLNATAPISVSGQMAGVGHACSGVGARLSQGGECYPRGRGRLEATFRLQICFQFAANSL